MQMREPIVVVTGADENYAIGLAVTVRSMLEHLSPQSRVHLYVMDGGISEDTKVELMNSWSDDRIEIHWLKANMARLGHLVISGHLNHTTYLRLLIPEILPESASKAIYLDSDLLIRRDITELWNEPMDGASALAGQETGAPYVDAEVVWKHLPSKYSKVGITTPVRNYREIGMNPNAKIFNAGVLVVNVDYWREHAIPQQAYECLEKHRDFVLFCDQYALNVVLANTWREIDTRWNQTAHFYNYGNCENSPFDGRTFELLKNDPWICHFTWKYKPWMEGCDHPFQREYIERMQQTHYVGQPLASHPDSPEANIAESPRLIQLPVRKRTWAQWWAKRKMNISKRLIPLTSLYRRQGEDKRNAA
jgi:lipopolysaccharide biosynthesis glycosyltransferase